MTKTRGTILLLITAFIWGVAFVAQSTVADTLGAFTFNAARMLLAAAFLLAVIGVRRIVHRRRPAPAAPVGQTVIAGVVCGAILFVASNLQQFGIAAYPPEAAASGRAGFITATYVIMVAVCSIFSRRRPSLNVLVAAVVCTVGMYFLCLSAGISEIYLGDVLVFLCAIGFTAYIFAVDRYTRLDGVAVSCVQFAFCGAVCLIAALLFEKPKFSDLNGVWLEIVYAGVFSGGIGYTFQIIGQKYAAPTVASIVMSLESVFAAVSGWIILHERLSGAELFGCVLVFLAVILAQLPALRRKKGTT